VRTRSAGPSPAKYGTPRFATKALVDSHEAKLRTATREGEAFDASSGPPLSITTANKDRAPEVSW
jgi:hypothetical protein